MFLLQLNTNDINFELFVCKKIHVTDKQMQSLQNSF